MGRFISVTRINGIIFETLDNQGKNNQPRIAVVGVYFALHDSVCDEESSFQIKMIYTVFKLLKREKMNNINMNILFNDVYSYSIL